MKKDITSILFVSGSTLIAGFLSYLYHPVMIRHLSIEDFGSFESILSVMNLVWVLINAIGLYYIKEVVKGIDDIWSSKKFRAISIRYIFRLSLIVSVIFLILIPIFSLYLKIPFYYFLPLVFTIVFSFLALTNNAYLQSLKKFKTIATLISTVALTKLILGYIFVLLGLGIFGALGGFIVSQVITFIIGFTILKNYFRPIPEKDIDTSKVFDSIVSQKKQILQYVFTSILIALLMNIDILIVKNIFDGEIVGYYAAISVIAKFLVFLGLSIETVYYPKLVKEKIFPYKQVLGISIYYIVLTICAIVFFGIFGEIVLKLFKNGLENYIGLIYPLLVYCGVLAYLSIIVKTLIAFEHYTINYMLGGVIILLIICLYSISLTPLLLAQIFSIFGGIGLIIGIVQIVKR